MYIYMYYESLLGRFFIYFVSEHDPEPSIPSARTQ